MVLRMRAGVRCPIIGIGRGDCLNRRATVMEDAPAAAAAAAAPAAAAEEEVNGAAAETEPTDGASAAKEEGEGEDEDDEEEEPEKASPPVLRGHMTVKKSVAGKDHLVYTGKWAFSAEKFAAGETSKFSLNADAPDSNTLPPKSAEFKGHFMMKSETAEDGKEKVKEKKVKIKFTKLGSGKYSAKGEGVNKFGEFDLAGTFNPEDNKMACTKVSERVSV